MLYNMIVIMGIRFKILSILVMIYNSQEIRRYNDDFWEKKGFRKGFNEIKEVNFKLNYRYLFGKRAFICLTLRSNISGSITVFR